MRGRQDEGGAIHVILSLNCTLTMSDANEPALPGDSITGHVGESARNVAIGKGITQINIGHYVGVARWAERAGDYRPIARSHNQILSILRRAWRVWMHPDDPIDTGLSYPAEKAANHLNVDCSPFVVVRIQAFAVYLYRNIHVASLARPG